MFSSNSYRFITVWLLIVPKIVFSQLTISQPNERKIYQRDNQNYALVPVQGSSSTQVDSVLAFFKPVQSGQGERQLFKLQLLSDAQNFRGRCKLKGGWYYLEIHSFKNGVEVATSTVNRVGVGEVFLIWGHSVAEGGMTTPEHGATDDRVNSINYYTGTVDYAALPTNVSHLDADKSISPFGKYAHCWSWFGDAVTSMYNVPVMLYSSAFGGSNLQQNVDVLFHIPFEHGFINYYEGYPYRTLDGAMKVYTPLSGVRAVFIHHGSNDRDYSGQTFKNNVRTIVDTTRGRNNMPELAFMMVQDARWFVGGTMTHICDAQSQIINESNQPGGIPQVYAGADLRNTPNDPEYTPDQLHFDKKGIEYLGNQWAASITQDFLNQSHPYLAVTPQDWPMLEGRTMTTDNLVSIEAVPDDMGTIPSNGGISSFEVLLNDKLNGVVPINTNLVNITISGQPKKGTTNLNSNGTIDYFPFSGRSGKDTLVYTICDKLNTSICDTALVVINISPIINASPDNLGNVASSSSINSFPILSNDILNGIEAVVHTVNISISTLPQKGTATINADGSLKYVPYSGSSGSDVFVYTICDKNNGSICDTALVVVNISSVIFANADDLGSVASNSSIDSFPILSNDNLNGSAVNSSQVDISVSTLPQKGTATINADGSLKYVPYSGSSGNDVFVYTICDKNNGSICDTAKVVVNISSVIFANADDLGNVASNSSISSFPILSNDNLNGSAVNSSQVNISISTLPQKGTATINADGSLKYVPYSGSSGSDVFVYTICDKNNGSICDTAKVVVNISSVIFANADDLGNVASNSSIGSFPILSNDNLNGSAVNSSQVDISVSTLPQKGTATINADGSLKYVPYSGSSGSDVFVYTICDKNNGSICDTAKVVVNISSVIFANADNLGVIASNGSILAYSILANDVLNGLVPNSSLINLSLTALAKKGTVTLNSDGTLNYIPFVGKSGKDTLVYTICDKNNLTLCDTAMVIVNIEPVIIANPDNMGNVASNSSILAFSIISNDNLNGNTTIVQTVNINISRQAKKGTATLNANGSLKYVPQAGQSGKDTLIYTICDTNNATFCDTAMVIVNITPLIEAVFNDMGSILPNDSILSFSVLSNDKLNGVSPVNYNLVNISISSQAKKGTATLNADGSIKYVPLQGQLGRDTLIYRICDKLNPTLCDTALVVVNISTLNVCLEVKVYLEGAMRGTTMGTELNQQGLLPGQAPISPFAVATPTGQPYNTTPWNFHTVDNLNTYNVDVVDWVLVSLRSRPEDQTSTFYTMAALLKKDGTVDFRGTCPALTLPDSVYVGITHRNHIGVISGNAVKAVNNKLVYDFTQHQGYIPANSPSSAQKYQNAKYMLYAADAKKSAYFEINVEDELQWRAQNGTFGKYLITDFNLDGTVDILDQLLFRRNNGVFAAIPFW